MLGNPHPLAAVSFPTYRQKMLYVASKSRYVTSFDPTKMDLVPHYWPVSGDVRVPPSGLRQYRATHQYLGPGCLCPLLEPLSQEPVFMEAAIYLTTFGRYQGEYVAECAKGRCGYLVPLERLYPMHGVPVMNYLKRDISTPCPAPVYHCDEGEIMLPSTRPLKRTYAIANLMDPPSPAPELNGMDLSHRTDWRKFVKLDCMDRPGLTEEEFWGLFVKCDACALITTHLMFRSHHCEGDGDLTDRE